MASCKVDVYVKLTIGRNVQYDLSASTCISKLISMVAKDEGAPAERVKLSYQGKVLIPTKTVGEYGVRPETILKSQILIPKQIALLVKLPDGSTEEITISNLDKIQTLFEIVSEKSGIEEDLLQLQCKGKMLKKNTTLLDMNIETCSEICVTILDKKKDETKKNSSNTAVPVPEALNMEEKQAVLSSFQCDGRRVEVVFSFDTTGSMYGYLSEVRSKLRDCTTRLIQDIPGIRIGLIAHGDYCDQCNYVLRSVDLTSDVESLVSFADDVPKTSGGDSPECYEWVLRKAQHLDWSEDSAKALVVIGDYYPHPPSYTDQSIKWRDELNVLKGMGVKVYGVQAGNNHEAEHFYGEIAELTEGKHLKLQHFDIITEMFLAVCYLEGDEQLLDDFQQELEGAGKLTDQTKAMFEELKKDDNNKEKKGEKPSSLKPKRHVASEWWDHQLEKSYRCPQFTYCEQTDIWSTYMPEETDYDCEVPERRIKSWISTHPSKKKKRNTKKGCIII